MPETSRFDSKTTPKNAAISAALKISGGPPLPNGFTLATASLGEPVSLQPGQWLTADTPIALFQQLTPDRLQLIVPQDAPERLLLKVCGQPRPQPKGPALLVSRGVTGLGGLLFAARTWRKANVEMIAIVELPDPPPFQPMPARFWLPAMPAEALAALVLLEDWGIPNRLASPHGAPGCFEGDALALAEHFTYHSEKTFENILFNDDKR